jgi:hypothetical protein
VSDQPPRFNARYACRGGIFAAQDSAQGADAAGSSVGTGAASRVNAGVTYIWQTDPGGGDETATVRRSIASFQANFDHSPRQLIDIEPSRTRCCR